MSRQSVIFSAILHGVLIGLFMFGLPIFLDRTPKTPDLVIIELLPVSEITNVKPTIKVEDKQEKKAEEQVSPPAKPKSKPLTEKADLSDGVKIKPKQKDEVKPKELEEKIVIPKDEPKEQKDPVKEQPKKLVEKKTEPKVNFDDIYQSLHKDLMVEEAAKSEDKKVEPSFEDVAKSVLSNKAVDFKESLPLSISEKEAIKAQIMRHWNVGILSGAKDIEHMIVRLNITVAPDGNITKVEHEKEMRYIRDGFYRAAVDSAIRAAYEASPLKGLPADKYEGEHGWNKVELIFDPTQML